MQKKTILFTLFLLIILVVLIISSFGNIFGFAPATTSNSSKKAPPTSSPPEPTIPPGPSTPAMPSSTIIFDFDRGTPTILEGQNTPLEQTSGGITASFSSASDPAAFSIQSYKSTFFTLSQFSDKFLYDNKITNDILYIAFSQPLTKITITFATVEYEGAGHVEEPSTMKLTVYKDSINTQPIGFVSANGKYTGSSFPQGELAFNSEGKPFNLVKIELIPQVIGGTDFYVDNIIVEAA